jgi:GDPmannose 4,6-dehydratase
MMIQHKRALITGQDRSYLADTPSDYVVSTGETHRVREFCELAFQELGLEW